MIARNFAKELVDDYVVFDLETTGFDPKTCEIIEIGALKYKQGKLVDEMDILINPKCPIPDTITNITGINDAMVSNAVTIEKALPTFISFIEDLTLIAHNSSFDLGFIEEKINLLGLPMITNKNIDTVYLARKYINTPNHKLETLKAYFHLDYGSHRSVDDCRTTNYVYEYCKDKALTKIS